MANTFEDLYIWKLSRELVNFIYNITDAKTFKDYSLKDQIRRASVSVLSNISEGFERGTKDEFLYFLYIAKGSCGEVRSQLYIALDRKLIAKSDFQQSFEKSRQLSAAIYKFIEGFKAKGYSGIRRKSSTTKSKEDEFMEKVIKSLDPKIRKIYQA